MTYPVFNRKQNFPSMEREHVVDSYSYITLVKNTECHISYSVLILA